MLARRRLDVAAIRILKGVSDGLKFLQRTIRKKIMEFELSFGLSRIHMLKPAGDFVKVSVTADLQRLNHEIHQRYEKVAKRKMTWTATRKPNRHLTFLLLGL